VTHIHIPIVYPRYCFFLIVIVELAIKKLLTHSAQPYLSWNLFLLELILGHK